ncbi:MAG: nucleoside monophosphate kinase [Candidatus Paceibacterota bacterium]|jgi:adenylate kinase
MEKLGFNLALMGMITSGKDTQANILKTKYSLKTIETGKYSRMLLKAKGKDGDQARKTVGKGKPLPVVLMKKFLINEISKKSKNKDLLFIGGPRLKPEAQLVKKILDSNKQKLFVIYITLPDKEVFKRSISRKSGETKNIYKVLDAKHLIAPRIKWHKKQVGKTVKYFEKLKILKKINGNQPINKVTKDIEKIIKENTNNN